MYISIFIAMAFLQGPPPPNPDVALFHSTPQDKPDVTAIQRNVRLSVLKSEQTARESEKIAHVKRLTSIVASSPEGKAVISQFEANTAGVSKQSAEFSAAKQSLDAALANTVPSERSAYDAEVSGWSAFDATAAGRIEVERAKCRAAGIGAECEK